MLTPEQMKIGRRNFLKAAAALPAVGAFAALHEFTGSRVRCGIIGTGGEGQVLLENAPANMLDVVCACDIRPPNLARASEIIKERWGHNLTANDLYGDDYTKMLERNDIEAVIIASPLWMHAPMTIDALNAGKHVMCEKTMAHSVQDCLKMKSAAQRAGKVLLIGHQRFYNPLYHQMKQMFDEGKLGEVYHVRALWHRNHDWRRGIDPAWEAEFGDKARAHGYADIEHLVNWRLYKKHSQGLMTELASHQIAMTNWLSQSRPNAVMCSGGIQRFNDGREIADHMYVIWEYPKNLTVTYSTIQSNRLDHYYEQIMGTKGSIYLTGETNVMLFPEPGYEKEFGVEGTEMGTEMVAAGNPTMKATASRGADAAAGAVAGWGGAGGMSIMDAYTKELMGFAQSIRNGAENWCDADTGIDAAVAVLAANDSMETKQRVEIQLPALASA